jgi:KaiC/GvpD/RAD55 family RecA-like ATPase
MLKNAINGLENLLMNEIPAGSVILVNGAEGTLKSGLVFSMLSNHITVTGEHGLYVSLEQTKGSHLQNMNSLRIKKLMACTYSIIKTCVKNGSIENWILIR